MKYRLSTRKQNKTKIPLGAWISVFCESSVLSGRDLGDGPIPRPEESYRLWCIIMCDPEPSGMRRPWSPLGCCARGLKGCLLYVNHLTAVCCGDLLGFYTV